MTGKTEQRRAQKKEFWAERLPLVNRLLNQCIEENHLKNDAALSRELGVAPPVISKLRHGKLHPCASIVLRIYWDLGIRVSTTRDILNLPPGFRF